VVPTKWPRGRSPQNWSPSRRLALPRCCRYRPRAVIVLRQTPNAAFAAEEFFKATLTNEHTRRAYGRIAGRFLGWCDRRGLEHSPDGEELIISRASKPNCSFVWHATDQQRRLRVMKGKICAAISTTWLEELAAGFRDETEMGQRSTS
jgi:hypothetical protein